MRPLLVKYYPFQVWISTLFLGSYLGAWLNFVRRPDTLSFETALLFPFLIFIMGLIATLPAMAVYYCSYWLLQKARLPVDLFKLILVLISIAVILATLYFLGGTAMLTTTNRDGFLLTLAYCLATIICGFAFTCPATASSKN